MNITELKAKHNERIITIAVTEIILAGLSRIASQEPDPTPLAVDVKKCFDDINNSNWDDIRAVIKRSL
ncbi:MAG: hypothetical protein J6W33_02525 [Spirochaetia bacterium]|nr:hypothetical protein [Spirochaetia bacterium]